MDHKDVPVAKTSELVDGEMKQVSAEGQEFCWRAWGETSMRLVRIASEVL